MIVYYLVANAYVTSFKVIYKPSACLTPEGVISTAIHKLYASIADSLEHLSTHLWRY